MAKKIFFGNYKGGVGKTTSVFSVAHYLAQDFKKKVLMIDIDPQSSLSEICLRNIGQKGTLNEIPANETLNYVFDLSIRSIQRSKIPLLFDNDKLIKKCMNDNIFYIISSLRYEEYLGLDELSMKMKNEIEYFSILPRLLESFESYEFDFILIDCPPTSNVITQSAFLLADYYLVPTIEDGISTSGVLHYIKTVGKTYDKYCTKDFDDYLLYKHFFGEKPQLLGIFYTLSRAQINYTRIEAEFEEELKKTDLPEKNIYVFKNQTDNYVDIARAIAEGAVIDKKNREGKIGYKEITNEILTRINELGG